MRLFWVIKPQQIMLAQRRNGAKMTENEIGKEVVDAAIAVHRELGPGLLESV